MKVDLAYPRPPKFLQPVTGHMYLNVCAIVPGHLGFVGGISFVIMRPSAITVSGSQLVPRESVLVCSMFNRWMLLFFCVLSASGMVSGCWGD